MNSRWRRFSKSVSHEEQRQIFIFVYQWNLDRILHINALGFGKQGLKEYIQFKKDIYKDFKIRFPLIKQPNSAIETAVYVINDRIQDELQDNTFTPALEID